MPAPTQEFIQFLRGLWRLLRWLAIGMAVLLIVILVAQIHSLWLLARGVHPWLGHGFLLAVAAGLWWGIGLPIWRFVKMPVVVKPPVLPERDEGLTRDHLVLHVAYIARYLRGQRSNPLMAEVAVDLHSAIDEAEALRDRLGRIDPGALDEAMRDIEAFERTRVAALLRPLDAEAERVIRNEALGVGVATAVSMNGTMDAFIVLWRNVNLVSKIARIYYGRPGPRAGLAIFRDVAATALLSNYLEGVTDHVGGLLGNWAGSVAGVVAGPLLDGGANALMTVRIGYLAKARCRSFQAWTDRHRRNVLIQCLKMTKDVSISILAEIARQTGGIFGGVIGGATAATGTIIRGAKGTIKGAKDIITGKWPRRPEEGEQPAT